MNYKHKYVIISAFFMLIAVLSAVHAEDYVLAEGDVLKITVYDNPDLTTIERITGAGTMQFPLIGEVKLAGLTISQATKKIAERLSDGYINSPQVNIFVQEYRVSKIFVTGEVKKPDGYKFEPGTTVLRAITLAGGFSDKASTGRVKIIRKTKTREEVLERVKMDEPVLPGDVIVVPESFF
jgi:protein involved in polysaccharide export with SLBB domain